MDELLVEAPVFCQLIDRADCGVDQPCSLGLALTPEALLGLEMPRGGGQLGHQLHVLARLAASACSSKRALPLLSGFGGDPPRVALL